MKTRKKTFDCIRLKRRIQKELMDEYLARKDEFASFADFIVKTADESEQIRAWRERIARAKAMSAQPR